MNHIKIEYNEEAKLIYERDYIVQRINEYTIDLSATVRNRLLKDAEVETLRKEAHFRAECGWNSFPVEADLLIESRIEELEDGIDLTEDEEE